jgi:photosynthetic reaction center H subunit
MPLSRVTTVPKQVLVNSILSTQFDDVPKTAHPNQVTFLEEDKISAYYGGGTLWATATRSEPLL